MTAAQHDHLRSSNDSNKLQPLPAIKMKTLLITALPHQSNL